MYFIVAKNVTRCDTLADVEAQFVPGGNHKIADALVIKGEALQPVHRIDLEKVGATATKRDKSSDEKLNADVLAFVRRIVPHVEIGVKAVADGLKITTGDVSRAKASLLKAGELALSKKGTLLAKAA